MYQHGEQRDQADDGQQRSSIIRIKNADAKLKAKPEDENAPENLWERLCPSLW